jgi:hypothetical protein
MVSKELLEELNQDLFFLRSLRGLLTDLLQGRVDLGADLLLLVQDVELLTQGRQTVDFTVFLALLLLDLRFVDHRHVGKSLVHLYELEASRLVLQLLSPGLCELHSGLEVLLLVILALRSLLSF